MAGTHPHGDRMAERTDKKATTPATLRGRWRIPAAILAVVTLMIGGLWTAVLHDLERDREALTASAGVDALNLARAFEEHVVRTINEVDFILRHIRADLQEDRASFHHALGRLQAHMGSDLVFHVLVSDRAGMLASSNLNPLDHPVDISDRDYFRALRDDGEDTLFISVPVLGRVSGRMSIQFARRLARPDGSFDGVVAVSVEPDYFTMFYDSIDIGPHGAITLVGTDGVIRARGSRAAVLEAPLGMSLSDRPYLDRSRPRAAPYRAISPVDGRAKLGAYRRLQGFPLVVLVLLDEEDVFASYVGHRDTATGMAVLLTLVLLSGSVVIAWLDGRQARLHAFLVEQARQLAAANEELRQAKAEADAARREAERANQAKSSFLAAMSHEFRTPLNGILGFSEIIREQALGPATAARHTDYAADIHESGRYLLTLIDELLDLSKIEAGKMTLDLEWLDLPEVVNSVVHLLAEQAGEKRIGITVAGLEGSLLLWGDDRAVRQILFNLLSNAIKYTPDGGHVTVGARADGEGVTLAITDTGQGIPCDQVATVFRPFERLDNSYRKSSQGTGIGLPLVGRLVELHHGALRIESVTGQGTAVTVRFPTPCAATAHRGASAGPLPHGALPA